MQPVSAVETLLSSPPTDLLRLLAVPVFGWAAARDIATRRVPNQTWLPLVALGVLLLAVDVLAVLGADPFRQRLFAIHLVVSLGLVAPLGYVFWRLGGFGGADAKAVMVLALLFPEFPRFFLPGEVLPLVQPPLGVFSLTVLSNTVLLGLAYPLVLAARNLARGHRSLVMFVGKSVPVTALATAYGSLLESPDGFTRNGLDLDALRMYLRWRGLTLSELRADPETYRDPDSLPAEGDRHDPGDGALADGAPIADGGQVESATATDAAKPDPVDEWGAATFLANIEGDAYGTTPEKLRGGLELLARVDEVWLTPGMPFIVPMFVGLVVALGFGDLLYALLQLVGLVP